MSNRYASERMSERRDLPSLSGPPQVLDHGHCERDDTLDAIFDASVVAVCLFGLTPSD